ncbi:MAG: DUF2163 domain-containing protein [Caulobacterales bacterium]|jgi:uncharacterized phage protein (TIGR02218 family)|nr:DUF2163 domain-containing protein [Caulobacterales bacterium]
MRELPDSFEAQLAEGVTTFAHVWRLARRDGAVVAFTDHDLPLVFDDLTCEPSVGLTLGAIDKSLGLAVDTASVTGALNSDVISEADLSRGLWDGARVDIFRVDWRDPSARLHLFAGRIGEVRRGASAFEAELRGLQAPLNTPVGRVFSRYCDADLGDTRCGKDVSGSMFRGAGVVTGVSSSVAFSAAGLGAFADGWFARGRIVWSDDSESEVAQHRAGDGVTWLELLDAPGGMLTEGAAFDIVAGCDKRFETCRVKFANGANFRGFTHMPGNDSVQAGPSATAPLDGGSRYS